jgi:hypothetical protein
MYDNYDTQTVNISLKQTKTPPGTVSIDQQVIFVENKVTKQNIHEILTYIELTK